MGFRPRLPSRFAITRESLVVYTSNVFAILGRSAMRLLLAGALGLCHLLRYGVGLILIFAGLQDVLAQRGLAGAFPKPDILRCDRWNSGNVYRPVARFSPFAHVERPADSPAGSRVRRCGMVSHNPVTRNVFEVS